MGLDISLIRIVPEGTGDVAFLHEEEFPEFEGLFGHLKSTFKSEYRDEEETSSGYYYQELGYQRKGVKPEFYDRYGPDVFISTSREAEELLSYIDKDHWSSFTSEIADKFVQGETALLISY